MSFSPESRIYFSTASPSIVSTPADVARNGAVFMN